MSGCRVGVRFIGCPSGTACGVVGALRAVAKPVLVDHSRLSWAGFCAGGVKSAGFSMG